MSSFFQPIYWLTLQPPEVSGLLGNVMFGVFLAFFIFGLIGRIVVNSKQDDRYKKEIGNRFSTFLITMGLLGMALFFFSFEGIQLFGARFWYPVWIVATFVWVCVIVRFVKRDVPKKRAREVAWQERGRYLPRRHHQ